MNRLKIIEYFELLVNRVDTVAELLLGSISKYKYDRNRFQTDVNERRNLFLDEIELAKQRNLELCVCEQIAQEEELFKSYAFFILDNDEERDAKVDQLINLNKVNDAFGYLVVVDSFVNNEHVSLFRTLVASRKPNYRLGQQLIFNGQCISFKALFDVVENHVKNKNHIIRTTRDDLFKLKSLTIERINVSSIKDSVRNLFFAHASADQPPISMEIVQKLDDCAQIDSLLQFLQWLDANVSLNITLCLNANIMLNFPSLSPLKQIVKLEVKSPCDIEIIGLSTFPHLAVFNLESIYIDYTNMLTFASNLSELTFADLPNLSELNLCRICLYNLDARAFHHLNKLTSLSLTHNFSNSLNSLWFTNMRELITLRLGNNKIRSLKSNQFEHLSKLQQLDLSSNQIDLIERFAFSNLARLKRLQLQWNQLKRLDHWMFRGLRDLSELDLSHNSIADFDLTVFDNLEHLNVLNLQQNKISYLYQGMFGYLSNLTALDMSQNDFSSIDLNVFRSLAALQTLDLHAANITHLDAFAFVGLSNLKTLKLESNRIEVVHRCAFNDLRSLKELNLSANAIDFLPPNVFNRLAELTSLNLTNNKFARVGAGTFNGLAKLYLLDLSRNFIDTIEPKAFAGLTKLVILHLENNLLHQQDPDWFDASVNLKRLRVKIDCSSSSSSINRPRRRLGYPANAL